MTSIDDTLVGTGGVDEYGEWVWDDGRTAMKCPECGEQVLFCTAWRYFGRSRVKVHWLNCSEKKKCGWTTRKGGGHRPPRNINIITKGSNAHS